MVESEQEQMWNAVDTYLSEHVGTLDSTLDAALEASNAAGLPPISVSANHGKFLMILAQIQGATRILEIGTLGGYSTIWLARGLRSDGKLITLEAKQSHADVARTNIERAGLADLVEIRVGRALETLPGLLKSGAGPFDLVFIDADKPSIPDYFKWVLKLSRPGSVIIVDNVIRNGALIDPEKDDPGIDGVRRLMDMLAAERRVLATAIQTVGSKGYDGFAIVRVLE